MYFAFSTDGACKVTRQLPNGYPFLHSRASLILPRAFVDAKVDALIAGLEELRCERTTGEDQTLCLMSDSFNFHGDQAGLQESGDLPPDEFLTIVEVSLGKPSKSRQQWSAWNPTCKDRDSSNLQVSVPRRDLSNWGECILCLW